MSKNAPTGRSARNTMIQAARKVGEAEVTTKRKARRNSVEMLRQRASKAGSKSLDVKGIVDKVRDAARPALPQARAPDAPS